MFLNNDELCLGKNTYGTIMLLGRILEEKDAYTDGHCFRLENLALKLGEKLGFQGEELNQLRIAAILHDLGKIAIPDKILNKESQLTYEEMEVIKIHPTIGADLVRSISGLERAALYINQHHEKYDGKGYPSGISGNDIEIGAQIISVVDAFDAMTTDRPYRKAISFDDAISELHKNVGTQFAPYIVEAFVIQFTIKQKIDRYMNKFKTCEGF